MSYKDVVGVVGVGLILLGYLFSIFKIVNSHSRFYFLLNTLGAALACYASYLILYWPFVILEGTWTLVSIIGFLKPKNP